MTPDEAKQWATEEGFQIVCEKEEIDEGVVVDWWWIYFLPWHLTKLFDEDTIPETEDQYWQKLADALGRWKS